MPGSRPFTQGIDGGFAITYPCGDRFELSQPLLISRFTPIYFTLMTRMKTVHRGRARTTAAHAPEFCSEITIAE
jgi:hypothetical protein